MIGFVRRTFILSLAVSLAVACGRAAPAATLTVVDTTEAAEVTREVMRTVEGEPTPSELTITLTPEDGPISSTPTDTSMVEGGQTPSAPTDTVIPRGDSTPPAPTPCPPDLCSYAAQFFLQRPIAPPGNDSIDVTYRFGSTQGKQRDPHHGVEFLNPQGTPVLAAADGVVVVAGSDMDPITPHGAWPILFYGPYSNFYGNLVVIEHKLPAALLSAFPDLPQPLFTLYGHLSVIEVGQGQPVQTGQEIGKVGMAGIATGSHLHFEVRLGENLYKASRNPELWLAPHPDKDGQPMGAIAGRFLNSFGNSLSGPDELPEVVLQHLADGQDGPSDFTVTVQTYEEKKLVGLPPWEESFGAGDLPAGWYRLSFPMGGLRQELVQVFPGRLTVVTFR
jgi:hypothetical protein